MTGAPGAAAAAHTAAAPTFGDDPAACSLAAPPAAAAPGGVAGGGGGSDVVRVAPAPCLHGFAAKSKKAKRAESDAEIISARRVRGTEAAQVRLENR